MRGSRELLVECDAERRAYLQALYVIRRQLTGHAVKAEHIRAVLYEINKALGVEEEKE